MRLVTRTRGAITIMMETITMRRMKEVILSMEVTLNMTMDMSSMMMISMRLGTMMKMNRLSSYRATL
jgi:hypothetical protein